MEPPKHGAEERIRRQTEPGKTPKNRSGSKNRTPGAEHGTNHPTEARSERKKEPPGTDGRAKRERTGGAEAPRQATGRTMRATERERPAPRHGGAPAGLGRTTSDRRPSRTTRGSEKTPRDPRRAQVERPGVRQKAQRTTGVQNCTKPPITGVRQPNRERPKDAQRSTEVQDQRPRGHGRPDTTGHTNSSIPGPKKQEGTGTQPAKNPTEPRPRKPQNGPEAHGTAENGKTPSPATRTATKARKTAQAEKNREPGATIIIGGPEPSQNEKRPTEVAPRVIHRSKNRGRRTRQQRRKKHPVENSRAGKSPKNP